MILYRFEKNGVGIYGADGDPVRDAIRAAGLPEVAYLDDEHPGPYIDPGMSQRWSETPDRTAYKFACDTLPALCRWFYGPKGVAHLLSVGAEVVAYEAPAAAVMIGRYQVAFDSREATRLGSLPADYVRAVAGEA